MPRPRTRRLLIAGPILAVALLLGACGTDEVVTEEQFRDDLVERTGISAEVAACLTSAIFEDYDQAERNRIYFAATEDELGDERRDELDVINRRCLAEADAA